jgi:hypothetical protein
MALAAAIVPAYAQQQSSGDPAASQGAQRILDEIGTATVEYWTPKLNDYKSRIDRTLSSGDLATLERLRVRWGVILEEQKLAVKGTEIKGGETSLDLNSQRKGNEVMEIFTAVKEIAGRYRGEFDQVGTVVTDDCAGYLTFLSEQTDRFTALSGAEVAANPNAKKFAMGKTKLQEMAAKIRTKKSRNEIAMVYAFAIEPVVMLYNGAGLNSLLSGMPGSNQISGITLPEMSALRQNFPNPASNSTTILYTLGEASSSTVIRLFDARGELVESYDQGARTAGEHEIEIDVSKLASGSYLYHLTVQTEKGPRVYSRTMQVVQ